MPRSPVPAYLRDETQREALAAELHTLADSLTETDDDRTPDRLTVARAARVRRWATETEEYSR